MHIKMMTDQAIEKCRTDAEEFARKVYGNPENADWLESFVGADPFVEKTFEIDDFELEVPVKGSPEEKDVIAKNCVTLHKALKELPAYILGDIRFWAWVTMTKGYKFAIYKSEISKDYIKNNWFSVHDNNRRSSMLQTIASEYFIGDMTYDSMGSAEPYALTPYLSGNRELYRNMVYRNISDVPAVSQALIKSWADYEKNEAAGKAVDRKEAIRSSMKFVSSLGSVMLVDAIPPEELRQKVFEYLCALGTKKDSR